MASERLTGKCPMAEINSISDKIIIYMKKKLRKKYGNDKPLRVFHAKSIGLVEAQIVVENNLEPRLRFGLFQEPKTYKAWVRFTNGSPNLTADSKKSARGMAIKVVDIENAVFYDEDSLTEIDSNAPHAKVQDIILLSSRLFYPGPCRLQLSGTKAALGNLAEKFFYGLKLLFISFKKGSVFLKSRIITPDVLEEFYHSCSPYAFGPKDKIKWAARPLKTITSTMTENPGDNFLRQRLIQDLSAGSRHQVAFELLVQFQENEEKEPIEDSAVIWKTPFHRVAIITIPPQNPDTSEIKQKDEKMFFCPGHALLAHAPLGGLNQIRSIVYKKMAGERMSVPKETAGTAT